MMAFKFDKQTFKQEFRKKFLVRRFKVSSVATILTILLTIVATLCFQFVNVKTSLKWPLCTSNQRISRRILSYQPLNSSKKWNILKMKLLSFHTTVVTLSFRSKPYYWIYLQHYWITYKKKRVDSKKLILI